MGDTQPGREITREGHGADRLVVYERGAPARVCWLSAAQTVVGRDPGADLRLADARVSGAHARIERTRATGVVAIADAGSRNGTFVDGRHVARATLEDGAVLRLGDTIIVYERGLPSLRSESPVESVAARVLEADLQRAAQSRAPVLLTGPTGAGKGWLARRIAPAGAPFVHVNCAAIPSDLFESELFGHARGAFTGASAEKPGLLEVADGGVLFLDEVGSLAPAHQAKLLTVLDDGVLRRVGSPRERVVEVRVLAAMNDDPRAALRDGRLRRDLFFRLAGLRIEVPPLRRRRVDIVPLLGQAGAIASHDDLSAEALEAVLSYDWPGNVRELLSLVGAIQGSPQPLDYHVLPPEMTAFLAADERRGDPGARPSAQAPPKATIERTLAAADGNVSEAARRLGKHRNQLVRWLRAYGIEPRR